MMCVGTKKGLEKTGNIAKYDTKPEACTQNLNHSVCFPNSVQFGYTFCFLQKP